MEKRYLYKWHNIY